MMPVGVKAVDEATVMERLGKDVPIKNAPVIDLPVDGRKYVKDIIDWAANSPRNQRVSLPKTPSD
jgi:hypothetical protein